MPPDVSATWSSPHAPLAGPAAEARLRLSLQAGPLSLFPRALPPAVAEALDGADVATLPVFDVSGPVGRLGTAVRAALGGAPQGPAAAMRAWLRDDILGLLRLYAGATDAGAARVRLQVVEDDMGRRFHVDAVAFRLLVTYRGPGTEWLPPRLLADARPNEPMDGGAVRRLERGTVAILRGARAASPGRPAVLHRSPPLNGTGQVRLLLAINEAG